MFKMKGFFRPPCMELELCFWPCPTVVRIEVGRTGSERANEDVDFDWLQDAIDRDLLDPLHEFRGRDGHIPEFADGFCYYQSPVPVGEDFNAKNRSRSFVARAFGNSLKRMRC